MVVTFSHLSFDFFGSLVITTRGLFLYDNLFFFMDITVKHNGCVVLFHYVR